jgi:transmembrane sensor
MSQKEYEILTDFINGTLKEEERKAISKHIKDYNSNRMNTEQSQQFNTDNAWNKLHERIMKEGKDYVNIQRFHYIRIAASIMLFLALSTIVYFIYTGINAGRFAEVQSGTEIKEVLLPDGSKITLNTNSSINYPKEFSGNDRTVEFKGEAFFEITKNPNKPFIVKSGDAEIRVLGTSFNVENQNNRLIRVFVETGKVQLADKTDNKITITPGEEGKLENNTLTENNAPDKNVLSWKTKSFVYENELLSKIIQDFNKVYHANIVFENDAIGNYRLTTMVLHEKSLNSALTIICTPRNLEFKTVKNQIIIYQK